MFYIQFRGCQDEEKLPLRLISNGTTVIVPVQFKWQYMAGAGAEIMDKSGAENK